jgi:copper transport protein
MKRRLWALLLGVAAIFAAAPGSALAHAYLVKTVPAASVILTKPPANIQLTYDEAVEPRFAIISVTNAQGVQETTAPASRSPANPDTLVVPLRRGLPEGWYLIYWRAISVDGHPVQGAFTYAVGPDPGPAPQFPVPSIGGTAESANVLIAKWVMFLSVMLSIGLFCFRFVVARPLVRMVAGASLRRVEVAFVASSVLGVAAIFAYLDVSTAIDSLRSVFDVGSLVPLFRVTAFGRGYVDLLLCFGLLCVAGWICLWLDKPLRRHRSVAELAAVTGAALAALACLALPGSIGHAGQTSPRGLSIPVDWLHLISGSIWIGGLLGLLLLYSSGAALRVATMSAVVPRFSNVAFGSVMLLLGTGTIATIDHMPALDALWDTSYGVAILVKIGILAAAMMVAAGNLLRTKPLLVAAGGDASSGEPPARLLSGLVSIEAVLVVGAIFVASLLSSIAPPPPAFALENSALAHVGPGRVAATVSRAGYELQVLVSPNKAVQPDSFGLRITRNGRPVTGASVTLSFNHLQMEMPQEEYQLTETSPGVYTRSAPALVMVGPWGLQFQITPKSGLPFNALIVDQANG